mgnify:CR=1 FL=1
MKTVLASHGQKSGCIRYFGTELEKVDERTQSAEIGYVLQNPDNQIVTDKVWHELAFGLESLGYDSAPYGSEWPRWLLISEYRHGSCAM